MISGAAHGLMVEHASTFNRVLGDFLGRAERAYQAGAASPRRTVADAAGLVAATGRGSAVESTWRRRTVSAGDGDDLAGAEVVDRHDSRRRRVGGTRRTTRHVGVAAAAVDHRA